MPKNKTKKSIASRIKVTGSGKAVRRTPGVGHLLSKKSQKVKRGKRKDKALSKSESAKYISLMGL